MNIILNSNIFEDMSRAIGALAVGGVGAAMVASNSLYTGQFGQNHPILRKFLWHDLWHIYLVEGGHRAVKFNRLTGVGDTIYSEGLHFR